MVSFKHSGDFRNLEKFFAKAKRLELRRVLERYGQEGVKALSEATPKNTGLTAQSWGYDVKINRSSVSIDWTNSNIVDGVPIAVVLQYGHATRNGGFVLGRDYINPALQPVFDKIAEEVWLEVTDK